MTHTAPPSQACAIIVGGLGSWYLFGFQITTNFVAGVALVIGSIFIYGSSVEQLTEWRAAASRKLGLKQSASYENLPLCDATGAEEAGEPAPSAAAASAAPTEGKGA